MMCFPMDTAFLLDVTTLLFTRRRKDLRMSIGWPVSGPSPVSPGGVEPFEIDCFGRVRRVIRAGLYLVDSLARGRRRRAVESSECQ